MSSGYGKQVLKKKLCHIGDGDKPDGFDPSACQTYRDIDQFLAEPDEEMFFDAIKAYVVTCVVSCRVAKEGSQKLQDKWTDFLDDYPTVEELEGDDVFDTIRAQVTICCGMNAAPPLPPPPGGGPGAAAAAGASGASGGGGGGGASVINVNTYKPKLSAMPKNFESTSQEFRHMQSWLTSDVRNHTKEAVSDACLMQLRIKDELELWFSNKGGHTPADWAALSEAEKINKWITERSTSSLRRPPIEVLFCFSFICFSVCFRVCHSKTSFYWAGDQRSQEYRPRRRCEAGPAAPKPMAPGNDVTFL